MTRSWPPAPSSGPVGRSAGVEDRDEALEQVPQTDAFLGRERLQRLPRAVQLAEDLSGDIQPGGCGGDVLDAPVGLIRLAADQGARLQPVDDAGDDGGVAGQ